MSDQAIQIYVRDEDGSAHWVDLRFLHDARTPVTLKIGGVEYGLSDLADDRRSAYFTKAALIDGEADV